MANRSISAIIIIVFVGFSFIITIPILILSCNFPNYETIDELLTYEYAPDNPSPIEKLNLNLDVGNVEIKYITTPVDYYAKIIVEIEMLGQLVEGKEYSDYFSIERNFTSPSPTFTMSYKPDTWVDPLLFIKQNVDINITLNANILFDINITINKKGNVHHIVPYAVTINNVDVNTNEGNIMYDFQYCTLEGNITGIANDGNIELVAYNPEYTRNAIWTYESKAGDITLTINHSNLYKIMNANITGSLVGNDFGDVILYYYDNTANIGAKITINNNTQTLKVGSHQSEWDDGFEIEELNDLEGMPFGYEWTSTDFPAITNYNLFLEGISMDSSMDFGWYEVHLSSS
ncbi:MAG: hypothetical protein ACW99E_15900 [Promethearchaeota archaeon]|jgi:hypothetical protein